MKKKNEQRKQRRRIHGTNHDETKNVELVFSTKDIPNVVTIKQVENVTPTKRPVDKNRGQIKDMFNEFGRGGYAIRYI